MKHECLLHHIERVLEGLNKAEAADHKRKGYVHSRCEHWVGVGRVKYIALDRGTSGAFLVERETGEIFNIRGYGRVDRNKKLKADLGNIESVDPTELHRRQYNYLR